MAPSQSGASGRCPPTGLAGARNFPEVRGGAERPAREPRPQPHRPHPRAHRAVCPSAFRLQPPERVALRPGPSVLGQPTRDRPAACAPRRPRAVHSATSPAPGPRSPGSGGFHSGRERACGPRRSRRPALPVGAGRAGLPSHRQDRRRGHGLPGDRGSLVETGPRSSTGPRPASARRARKFIVCRGRRRRHQRAGSAAGSEAAHGLRRPGRPPPSAAGPPPALRGGHAAGRGSPEPDASPRPAPRHPRARPPTCTCENRAQPGGLCGAGSAGARPAPRREPGIQARQPAGRAGGRAQEGKVWEWRAEGAGNGPANRPRRRPRGHAAARGRTVRPRRAPGAGSGPAPSPPGKHGGCDAVISNRKKKTETPGVCQRPPPAGGIFNDAAGGASPAHWAAGPRRGWVLRPRPAGLRSHPQEAPGSRAQRLGCHGEGRLAGPERRRRGPRRPPQETTWAARGQGSPGSALRTPPVREKAL